MATTATRTINGCAVIWSQNGTSIINHPNTGFQVYSGGRIGTRKTLGSAVKLAEKTNRS